MIEKQPKTSDYILGTDARGASNLDVQHEIFKYESFAQLKEAGLTEKMIVWDIGCGNGAMTEYLANAVGPEGQVYAIDASDTQIKAAKNRIDAAGHNNVHFIVGDVNEIDNPAYQSADIVYARFLLMHVHDAEKIIKHMVSLLKPSGVISLQESTMISVKEENNGDLSINKFYDLMIEYGKLKGFDYNVGRKLPEICNRLNIFSKVNDYTRNYRMTDAIKNLISLRIDELKDKFVSSHLISEDEYIEMTTHIDLFFKDNQDDKLMVMAEQSHILAYK